MTIIEENTKGGFNLVELDDSCQQMEVLGRFWKRDGEWRFNPTDIWVMNELQLKMIYEKISSLNKEAK